jgi:hypothetical protein
VIGVQVVGASCGRGPCNRPRRSCDQRAGDTPDACVSSRASPSALGSRGPATPGESEAALSSRPPAAVTAPHRRPPTAPGSSAGASSLRALENVFLPVQNHPVSEHVYTPPLAKAHPYISPSTQKKVYSADAYPEAPRHLICPITSIIDLG